MITISAFTFMLACAILIRIGAAAGRWDSRRAAEHKARMDAYHRRWQSKSE